MGDHQTIEDDLITLFRKLLKVDFSAYIRNLSREEFFMLGVIENYSRQNQGKEFVFQR